MIVVVSRLGTGARLVRAMLRANLAGAYATRRVVFLMIHAVIPARGGSKRLPGKNLMELDGVPLIAHSIRFALEHRGVDGVYVSTDDVDIADAARTHGARVIVRPAQLGTDRATTSSVIAHALRAIGDIDPDDAIVTLQPTSPLRLDQWLDDCVDVLAKTAFDSVITVSPVTAKLGTIEGGRFVPSYQLETRGQDMAPQVRENGAIYLTRAATVSAGSVFGDRIGAVITDHPYATIDIDTRADFDRASAMMESTA